MVAEEHRLARLREQGDQPDPRVAQLERLKAETSDSENGRRTKPTGSPS